jgi:hypothetical protein
MGNISLAEALNEASELLSRRNRANNDNRLYRFSSEGFLTIVGDVHGNYEVIKQVLKVVDLSKSYNYLLFLGDYVDRGINQIKVVETLANLIIDYSEQVVILRGNHEGPNDVPVYPNDFSVELMKKHNNPEEVMSAFNGFKKQLFNAALIPEYAFLVHGFIPTNTLSLDDIGRAHLTHPADETLIEILWNDPGVKDEDSSSFRGAGHIVGLKTLDDFLKTHHLQWVVRGHENVKNGYRIQNKTVTLHTSGNNKNPILRIPLDDLADPISYLYFLR